MRGWMKVLGGIAIGVAALLVIGLILHYTGGPDEDASAIVGRAADALDEVAVRGTVVTVVRTPQGRRETRAEMHRGDGRFRMRLLGGPGEGTVVYRQEGAVWVERPDGERVRRAHVGDHTMRGELLARNWAFTTAGTRRVAGRMTTLVRGAGPGGSIQLAVDPETGFPLHISRRDQRGEVISETTWMEADFSADPPPEAVPPPPGDRARRKAMTLEEVRAAVDFEVFEPGWLPEGWELQGWYLNDRPAGTMVQARFSDGLRPMTIIQLSATDLRERLQVRREDRPDPGRAHDSRDADDERRPRRERPERPEGPDQPDRPARRWMDQRGARHLRGAGADASRGVIDGTMVIVSGPVSDATRERVLASMANGG